MNQLKKGNNVRRFYAGAIAFSMAFTAFTPSKIKADATQDSPALFETEYDHEGEYRTEDTERGEYVIFAENEADVPAEQLEYADELADNAEEAIYEADLSAEQLTEFIQSENVQVEENFFLFGSNTEPDPGNEDFNPQNSGTAAWNDENADWNYRMIRSEPCEPEGEPVKVAVLDSGVELISGIPVCKSINLVKEEQDLPYYMNDMVGHGTAVADIIHKICPDAGIYAVRVLDRENKGRLGDIVEGIYWCIEQDVDIINMSFGTSVESEILQKAIQAATDRGILIVSSAGNGGRGASVEYPAAFEEVMAVGAVDPMAVKTEESATGPEVELVAPGEQIVTKSMFGMQTVSSGTSMAAPHVTGAAAALMSIDNEKDALQIRLILDASGNPLGDSEKYGNGLVDLAYAKQLLEEEAVFTEPVSAAETERLSDEKAENISNENAESVSLGEGSTSEELPRETPLTFADVDYVEGRWGGDIHRKLIEDGAIAYEDFSATEIKLLKEGAAYPDDEFAMKGKKYPEWHGQFRDGTKSYEVNYIANYIFATRIALAGGDTSGLTRVKGQEKGCYDRMKKIITTSAVTGKAWGTIIKETAKLDYDSKSAATKKKWRKIFLYGMACHTATDAFAHATFYLDPATQQKILLDHGERNDWADKSDQYTTRFDCAGNTAYKVAVRCKNDWEGDVFDFCSYGEVYWSGFYMGNLLHYAITANDNIYYDKTMIRENFRPINYYLEDITAYNP